MASVWAPVAAMVFNIGHWTLRRAAQPPPTAEFPTDGRRGPAPEAADPVDDREQLRATLKWLSEAVISVDTAGRVFLMNAAAERLTGYSRQEAHGRPLPEVFRVVTEDTRQPAENLVERALREGKPCGFGSFTALISKDGAERPVAVTASPTRAESGAPLGVVISFNDVTEGRKLRLESRRVGMMVEQAAQGIAATDSDGVFTFANPTMAAMHGYQPDELIGKRLGSLYAPGQVSSHEAFLELVRRNGHHTAEVLHARKDGSAFPVELKVSLLKEGPTRTIGMVVFVLDIARRKRAEAELQAAKETAEAASKSKSEFLANMSHEIRTPMNGVIGMTELVLDTPLTREQREYLQALKTSANSLLTLLNDILDISKIEAGRLELEPIEFSLRETLGEILKTLAVRAHAKGLELIYRAEPGTPDSLVGDAGRLRQILINLVGNSIKFTERGEVAVHVRAETDKQGSVRLLFDVCDTGIGIPQPKQGRIFGPFFQADSSTTRKYGGTGLGLAISSRLVKMMDGTIWVESPSPLRTPTGGPGAIFHFTACFALGRGAVSVAPVAPPDVEHLSVLVADDNATSRRLLGDMLKGWRMDLRFADGGRAAMDMLREAKASGRPFGLVLLDASMPGLDGFSIAEKIKEDPELADATIMMLTTVAIRGDAARCNKLGVAAYLVKPVTQSELLDSILRALGDPKTIEEQAHLVRTRHAPAAGRAGARILLAEDNPVNQILAVRLLEKAGYSVQVAENGSRVMEIVERGGLEEFAVVLMDVQMPQKDGFEATAEIREREKKGGRRTPIIALTAHAMKGDRERCLAAGMDDYVPKPIRAQELLGVIEKLLPPSGAAPAAPAARAAAPADSPDSALNREEVLSRVDGDFDLLRELSGLFMVECPKLLTQVREALTAGNGEALGKAAHTLKGMLLNLSAKAAGETALQLEKMGKEGRLAAADDAYAALEKEIERFSRALAALLEEAKL